SRSRHPCFSRDWGSDVCSPDLAEDAALLLEAMAGFDPRDSTALDEPVPRYSAELETPWERVTIGVPDNFFDEGLAPANAEAVREVGRASCRERGSVAMTAGSE